MNIKLSKDLEQLIEDYQTWQKKVTEKEDIVMLKVNEVISKMTMFYEQTRKLVDWKEEHLMRRVAIKRLILRRLFLQGENTHDPVEMAEPFVLELIRGGHFPNNKIPKYKIKYIQEVINKYVYIIKNKKSLPRDYTSGEFYARMIEIMSCEIEEVLDPHPYMRAKALITYMENLMQARLKESEDTIKKHGLKDHDRDVLIYVNVQEALMNYEKQMIRYNLLKRYYPNWFKLNIKGLEEITLSIPSIFDTIDRYFEHPLASRYYNTCYKHKSPILIIDDIISENPSTAKKRILNSQNFKKQISISYHKRLKVIRKRKNKSAVFSTLSIFLTNVVSLYLFEIPFTKYVTGHINTVAAVLDIAGPTGLMFVSVAFVGLPKKKNYNLLLREMLQNSFQETEQPIFHIDIGTRKNKTYKAIFNFIYYITFIIVLGLFIYGLKLLEYPPLSFVLIIIFTSLISFTANVIQKRAKELNLYDEKDNIFQFILDVFGLPLISLGKWLSRKWGKINIVSVAFNVLIDAPFHTFMEFSDQWSSFIRDKKDEMK